MFIKRLMDHLLSRRAFDLFNRIKPYLPESGTLLDIGCGTGHNAHAIRQRTHLSIVETDVANLKTSSPPPILFDGHRLPFEANVFHCSLLLFILHYPDDPVSLLKEARRVTTGKLVVIQSTYSGRTARIVLKIRDWFQGILAFHLARFVGLVGDCPCPLYPKTFMDRETLTTIFSQAGWTVQTLEPSRWPFIQISRDLFVLERQ